MPTLFRRVFGRPSIAVALFLMSLMLAACGTAAQPQATTAPPVTATQATADGADAAVAPAASAKLAPTFELPNAAGETVRLASYSGDRNVVLVFYRGFW